MSRKYIELSEAETQALKSMWGNTSLIEMADKIGHCSKKLSREAHKLGLPKRYPGQRIDLKRGES